MSELRTDDAPGAYYTPKNTVNHDQGISYEIPAASDKLINPPYHIETRTQRIARLGVEQARLMGEMYKTQMTPEQVAALSNKVEKLTAEILTLSENWEPSNE